MFNGRRDILRISSHREYPQKRTVQAKRMQPKEEDTGLEGSQR